MEKEKNDCKAEERNRKDQGYEIVKS